IQCASVSQPRYPIAGRAVKRNKTPPDKHLAAPLQSYRHDAAIRSARRVEAAVRAPAHVEPSHPIPAFPIVGGEIPADDRLAVPLHGDREHFSVGSCPREESIIKAAIGVESGDSAP